MGNGFTLDSTSMRCPLSAATASAGEAADDDAEEGDDGVDDCLKTSSDGVDNGHDAVSDGAELESVLGTVCVGRQVRDTYDRLDARDDGTHDSGVVLVEVSVV